MILYENHCNDLATLKHNIGVLYIISGNKENTEASPNNGKTGSVCYDWVSQLYQKNPALCLCAISRIGDVSPRLYSCYVTISRFTRSVYLQIIGQCLSLCGMS